MERILIIGGNGCGKTTFARKLSLKMKLPLVHLDVLYWRDNWETASKEEFDDLLLKELIKSKWIIDGNISSTLQHRLKYCDTVIYMDFPRWKCLYGSIKRVIINYGRSRPDMGGYCIEKFNRNTYEFFKNVWNFNKNNRKRFYSMINDTRNVKLVVLKNRKQVNNFLKSLSIMNY